MRPFSIISPTIWTGSTAVAWRERGKDAQLIGHYLAESPHSNQYGLFRQSLASLMEDVGVERAAALEVLHWFGETDYAHFDPASQWVFVTNMWEWQLVTGRAEISMTDKRVLGLHRWYAACPPNPWLGRFWDRYGEAFRIPARRGGAVVRVAPMPAAATEPAPPVPDPDLDAWLAAYPAEQRTGRHAIEKAWAAILIRPPLETMLQTLAWQKRSTRWLADGGRFVPHASRYLSEGRYLDVEGPAGASEDDRDAEEFRRRMAARADL